MSTNPWGLGWWTGVDGKAGAGAMEPTLWGLGFAFNLADAVGVSYR